MASIVTIADFRNLTALPQESVNDTRLQQVLDGIDATFTAAKGSHPVVMPDDSVEVTAEKNADLDRREMVITNMAEAFLNREYLDIPNILALYPATFVLIDRPTNE